MNEFLHDITWVLPLRTPALTVLFNVATFLGYAPFFLIILPFGYWLFDRKIVTRVVVLLIFSSVLNLFLKYYFEDPRPPIEFSLDGRVQESFGFPSGHAQITAAIWVWFAYELRKRWFWVFCAFVIILVSLSRLYLGVHDVEDVGGGLFIGLASVLLYRWVVSESFAFWHNAHRLIQLTTLLAILPGVFFFWPAGYSAHEAFGLLGFLFGWWFGITLIKDDPAYSNKALVGLAGLVAVVILVLGYGILEKLFLWVGLPSLPSAWIQGCLIGLYITALLPVFFAKFGMVRGTFRSNKKG